MCAVISSRRRPSGLGSRPRVSTLDVARGNVMGATLARAGRAGSARGVDDGMLAEPRLRARPERATRGRIEAGGIEAVPIVERDDRAELGGVNPLDPCRGRLPWTPPATLALQPPLDQ